MTLLSILFLGFFLGMRHATDSDHVIAVTTIVSRQGKIGAAARTGIFWGIGHSLTLMVVGGAIILFGVVIPERVGLSLEFCVALMLILLGLLNLRTFRRGFSTLVGQDSERHHHAHQHGDYVHDHDHNHTREEHGHRADAVPPARLDRWFGEWRVYRALRPMVIGVVHGLAGSAAVALLVLPIIRAPLWAMAYLLVFGIGTIAGMMLITAAISVPVVYTARRSPVFGRWIGATAGAMSLLCGLFLVYEIGFVGSLFR